jgi:hypothetical protein
MLLYSPYRLAQIEALPLTLLVTWTETKHKGDKVDKWIIFLLSGNTTLGSVFAS